MFGVWCLVFGVWCLVFGAWSLGFSVQCLVFSVWCLGLGLGFRVDHDAQPALPRIQFSLQHPEHARMSGRHGVQYVAQCVACAALTLVVWQ